MQLQMECGGNGRSEFSPPARGNQWSTGAIGCPEWTGIRIRDLLDYVGIKDDAVYVAYEGKDRHLSGDINKKPISRGVPLWKAMPEICRNALLKYAYSACETKKDMSGNTIHHEELEKQLAALIKKQNDIHELVQNAAKDAQSTHEQAMLLEEKIQKMKVDANQMHKKSKSTKSISDDYHKIFILFIERKNELVDIVNKIQENEL